MDTPLSGRGREQVSVHPLVIGLLAKHWFVVDLPMTSLFAVTWRDLSSLIPRSCAPAGRDAEEVDRRERSHCHWRDCHFADALSPSILKHLLNAEGGAAE